MMTGRTINTALQRGVTIAIAAAVWLAAGTLHGEHAGFADASRASREWEARAADLFAKGDFPQARIAALQWMLHDLSAAADMAGKYGASQTILPPESAVMLAHAETALVRAGRIATDAFNDAAAAGLLQRALEFNEPFPYFASIVRHRIMELAIRRGNWKQAESARAGLGIISEWRIAGPFNNEGGIGFSTEYPPESDGVKTTGNGVGSWRKITRSDPDGVLDLSRVMEPAAHVVAYAYTSLINTSGATTEAVIRLASDDGVKVWLNGETVIARNVRRPAAFDQDAAGVLLRPGANALLVKVTQYTGQFALLVRVTDTMGRPLQNVRVHAEPIHNPPAGNTTPGGFPFRRGGEHYLYYRDESGRLQPAPAINDTIAFDAAFWTRIKHHAGLLMSERRSDSISDHPGRSLLRAALADTPDRTDILFDSATVSGESAASASERDINPGIEACLEILKRDPDHIPALYFLARSAFMETRNPDRAEDFVRRILRINPDFIPADTLAAEIKRKRGWRMEAFLELSRAVRHTGNGDGVGPETYRVLAVVSDPDSASDWMSAALKRASGDPAMWLAACRDSLTRSADGGTAQALHLAREANRLFPYHPGIMAELVRLELNDADPTRAIAVCRDALFARPNDIDWLMTLASAHWAAGQTDAAKKTLRRARHIDPGRTDISDLTAIVSNRPLAPDAGAISDSDSAKRIAARADTRRWTHPADRAEYLLKQDVQQFNADGAGVLRCRRVIRILDARGAKRLKRHSVRFDTEEERVEFIRLAVFKPDGGIVTESPSGPYATGRASGVWGRYTIEFPDLKPGDIIDMEWTISRRTPGRFGRYFDTVFPFTEAFPVRTARYVFIAPRDADIRAYTPGINTAPATGDAARYGMDPSGELSVRVYELNDLPAYDPPSGSGRSEYRTPRIEISSIGDWHPLGKWYWGLIRDQLTCTDAMRAAIAPPAGSPDDTSAVLRRVFRFVSRSIRYQQWHFGVHGYKPYRAETIFNRRFGDCKDKTILAISLLKDAGIQAWPLLLYATRPGVPRTAEDLTLARLSHFNHVILYIPDQPGLPGPMFLDPTSEYHAFDQLPYSDQGAEGYVVRPDGGMRIRIPWDTPEQCRVSWDQTVWIRPDGRATIKFNAVLSDGHFAFLNRMFLRNERYADYNIRRLQARAGRRVTLISDAMELPDEPKGPVSRRFEYSALMSVRDYAETTVRHNVSTMAVRLLYPYFRGFNPDYDMFPASLVKRYTPSSTRNVALFITAPWRFERKAVIHMPPGYSLIGKILVRNVDISEGNYKLVVTPGDGNQLAVTETLTIRAQRIEPERYRVFRRFCIKVDRMMTAPILLSAPVSKDAPILYDKTLDDILEPIR